MDEDAFDERWRGYAIPQQDWHFHRRLWERYGIYLKVGEAEQLLQSIKDGSAFLLYRSKKRPTSLYYVVLRRQSNTLYQGKQKVTRIGIFLIATNRLHLFMTAYEPTVDLYLWMESKKRHQRRETRQLEAAQ